MMAKFKKGVKVRVICNDEFVPKGTVLTIKSGPVGSAAGGNYYFEERRGIILGNDLELVTEASELTTKFNVGDVVVTLAKCGWAKSGQGVMLAGAIGKVKAVDGDLLTVKFNKKQPTPNATKEDRKNFVVRTSEVRLATAEEAATITKKKKKAEVITFEGEQYRKVDRKAQAGDVFVINHNDGDLPTWFTVGKPYKAIAPTDSTEEVSVIADDGDDLHVYNDGLGRTTETIDVYEKVEAKQSSYVPREGDIVVVTDASGSTLAIGDVGKITVADTDGTFRVTVPNKRDAGNWMLPDEIRLATPAEVAQYEQALADASKPEVKAPVLKVGDYVKFEKGDIWIDANKPYEVFEDSSGFYMVDNDDDKSYMALRLYKYEILSAEEVAKHVESDKWAKIGRKVGEFKKGDIVRIIEEIGSGFIEGTLGVVAKDCNDGENSPLVKAYAADEGEIDSYYAEVELVAPVESTLI